VRGGVTLPATHCPFKKQGRIMVANNTIHQWRNVVLRKTQESAQNSQARAADRIESKCKDARSTLFQIGDYISEDEWEEELWKPEDENEFEYIKEKRDTLTETIRFILESLENVHGRSSLANWEEEIRPLLKKLERVEIYYDPFKKCERDVQTVEEAWDYLEEEYEQLQTMYDVLEETVETLKEGGGKRGDKEKAVEEVQRSLNRVKFLVDEEEKKDSHEV
jgi:hypothetical protein